MADLSKISLVCKDCIHTTEHTTNWQDVTVVAVLCFTVVLIVFIVFLFLYKGINNVIEYKEGRKNETVKKILMDYLQNDEEVKTELKKLK